VEDEDTAVANAEWNATIPPGESVRFGFVGTWNTANTEPTAFTLNGAACRSDG
ncbi:MAG: hypothetical protein HKP61_05685, partial [Dactylosporangium sp.]|nr:cellulose-binding domain-containing protein [Dactylosporangium sp.]NNJ60438.1 hypothetical protein [Dactylosporangium sp.]